MSAEVGGILPLGDRLAEPSAVDRLAAAALDGSVFSGPAMLGAAPGRVAPDDWLAVQVPSRRSPGDLDALAVVRRARAFPLVGPRMIEGWWSHYGPRTPPLIRAGDPDAAARLLAALAEAGPVVRLRFQPLDSPSTAALIRAADEAGCATILLDEHQRAALAADAPAAEALGPALQPKRIRDLNRQMRRLEEAGPTAHRVEREPAGVLAALDALAGLEVAGWKRRTALAARDAHLAFARDFVRRLAEAGRVRADVLDHGGRPVAVLITLLAPPHAYAWKMAFDESLGFASPGAQVVRLATEGLLAEAGISLVDSLATPGHPLMERMWAGRIRVGTLVIATTPKAGSAARAVARTHARETRLRDAARRLKAKLGR